MKLFFYFFAAITLIACDDNYSFDATASSGLHKTAPPTAMDAEEADVGRRAGGLHAAGQGQRTRMYDRH